MRPLSMGRRDTCITRWYRSPVTGTARAGGSLVRYVAVRSGCADGRPHDLCTSVGAGRIAGRRDGTEFSRFGPCRSQVVGAACVPGGCGIRPIPRVIGDTTYRIAPNAMIDRTLMTQSRMVIAVA